MDLDLVWSAVVAAVFVAWFASEQISGFRKAGTCSACRAVAALPTVVMAVVAPVYIGVGLAGVSVWVRGLVAFVVLTAMYVALPG